MTSREPRRAMRLSLKDQTSILSDGDFERKILALLFGSALISYEMLVITSITMSEISNS